MYSWSEESHLARLTVLSVRLSSEGSRLTSSPILASKWMTFPAVFMFSPGIVYFILTCCQDPTFCHNLL